MGHGASASKTKKVYVVSKEEVRGNDEETTLATVPKLPAEQTVGSQETCAPSLASVALASSGGSIGCSNSAAAALAAAGVRPSSRERPNSRERPASRERPVSRETKPCLESATPGQEKPPKPPTRNNGMASKGIPSCGDSEGGFSANAALVEVDVTSEDGMPRQSATTARGAGVGSDRGEAVSDFAALCNTVAASACEENFEDDEEPAVPNVLVDPGTHFLSKVKNFVDDEAGTNRCRPTVCTAPRRTSDNPRNCDEYKNRAAERDRWLESLGVVREAEEKKPPKVPVTVAVPLRDRAEGVKDETRRWISRMQRHERGSFGSALLLASRSFSGEDDED